tara:strand:- start:397 stop:1071 length:675 start_codon:yes stop_codon:yes gene_type:complete
MSNYSFLNNQEYILLNNKTKTNTKTKTKTKTKTTTTTTTNTNKFNFSDNLETQQNYYNNIKKKDCWKNIKKKSNNKIYDRILKNYTLKDNNMFSELQKDNKLNFKNNVVYLNKVKNTAFNKQLFSRKFNALDLNNHNYINDTRILSNNEKNKFNFNNNNNKKNVFNNRLSVHTQAPINNSYPVLSRSNLLPYSQNTNPKQQNQQNTNYQDLLEEFNKPLYKNIN